MTLLLLLALLAIGAALYSLLAPERSSSPGAGFRRAGAALGLGAGLVHGLALVLSDAGAQIPLGLPWLLAPAAILWLLWIGWRARPVERRALTAWEALLLLGLGYVVVCVAVQAVSVPLRAFDSRAIYATTAKILFHEGGIAGEAIQYDARIHYHRNYPLLIPHLEAMLFQVQGGISERGAKPIFPLFFASLLALFYGVFRSRLDRATSLLATLFLASPPFLGFYLDGGAVDGYADVPFGYLFGASVAFLCLYLRDANLRWVGLAGLFLGVSICTKNEGVALTPALAGLLACFGRGRLRWQAPALFVAGAALVAAPWLAIQAGLPRLHDESYTLRLVELGPWQVAALLPGALAKMWEIGFELEHWGPGWLLAALAPVLGWGIADRRLTLFLVGVIAAQVGLYALVYAVTPHQLHWHVSVSWNRLLVHVWPVAVLLTAVQVEGLLAVRVGAVRTPSEAAA